MGMLKSLNVINLHRVMTMLKLKINVNLPQLLCIVISAAHNGFLNNLVGFALTVTTRYRRRQGWKAHFQPLQC